MTTIHPTDDQIQDYCLHNDPGPAVIDHIGICGICQSKAVQYTVMLEGIEKQPDPVFAFNITALVMEQLPAGRPGYSFGKYSVYGFFSLVVLLLCVLIYPLKNYLPGMVAGLRPLLISLIVLTALIISFFLCLDMYMTYKKKMDAITFS
jgi:hypothetical protein